MPTCTGSHGEEKREGGKERKREGGRERERENIKAVCGSASNTFISLLLSIQEQRAHAYSTEH